MSTLDTIHPSFEYIEESDLGFSATEPTSAFQTEAVTPQEMPALRTWTLAYENIYPSEAEVIRGVFDGAKTGDGTTTFTPLGGSLVTVRFLDDVFEFEFHNAVSASGKLRVKEVR